MILKIRDERFHGWAFYDDVAKAKASEGWPGVQVYQKPKKETGEPAPLTVVHHKNGDRIFYDECLCVMQEGNAVRIVSLVMRDGKALIILCGSAAYLLNDSGKTIERL